MRRRVFGKSRTFREFRFVFFSRRLRVKSFVFNGYISPGKSSILIGVTSTIVPRPSSAKAIKEFGQTGNGKAYPFQSSAKTPATFSGLRALMEI